MTPTLHGLKQHHVLFWKWSMHALMLSPFHIFWVDCSWSWTKSGLSFEEGEGFEIVLSNSLRWGLAVV